MSYVSLVMRSGVKTSLRMRSVVLVAVGVVFICVVGVAIIFATQFIGPGMKDANPDSSLLANYLGLILFTTSFMSIGIFASVIAFQSLVREKTRGNIQALLATPLTPADLWLGKTLAVFAPGFVFAVIMTIAVFIVINSIYFIPEIGVVLTPGMLVSSLVVVPLMYFALMLLVHEIGISARPVTANILAQLFLPVVITLMINLVTRDVINAGSWLFTVVLLGLALLIGAFVLVLRSKLTVEKIILSQ